MIRQGWRWVILVVLLLAACGEENTAPQGDPPILKSFESMPKELATIVLTPTPSPVVAGGQTVNVAQQASPTPGPPPLTATMTPYVGIFLGEPTSESGEAAPNTIPTLAPYVLNPSGGSGVIGSGPVAPAPSSGGACSIPVTAPLANAYRANPGVQQQLGCPVSGGLTVQLVTQTFERGTMYWRDTRQIFALAASGQFWPIADAWQEGMPADDPAFASPPAGLIQPVRGFGLAWRSNEAVRNALGWATLAEAPYTSTWQDFERGALFVGGSNLIYAIYPGAGTHSGPLAP